MTDTVVLFRGKVYVPLDAQLWHDIVEAHHDTLVTGHLGTHRQTAKPERVNQEVEQFLHLFVNQRQDNWYDWQVFAQFCIQDGPGD